MPTFGFAGATLALFIFDFEKTSAPNAHVEFSGVERWALSVGRFLSGFLVDGHVLIVLLQLLSVLGDLDGFRIENANRYVFTAEFNCAIRRGDPSLERSLSLVAERNPHVSSFERLDGDSILVG